MAGDNWYTCTSAMTAEIRALGASPKGACVDRGQRSWAGRHLLGGAPEASPRPEAERALLVPGGVRGCLRSRLFQVSWR